MILDGMDLDINNLMMQLKLENGLVIVYPISLREVKEHGSVTKIGAKNETKEGLEMSRTNQHTILEQKQAASCALKFFEKQLCNVA
jgi:hypothetical protein